MILNMKLETQNTTYSKANVAAKPNNNTALVYIIGKTSTANTSTNSLTIIDKNIKPMRIKDRESTASSLDFGSSNHFLTFSLIITTPI